MSISDEFGECYDRWRGLINHFTEINEVTRASFFGPSQSGGLV